MQWISYSAILFSVCYFSLALLFSRGVTAQFPDADHLAGFLGLFQSLTTVAALLASLFLANRSFARFGILPMLLLFPLIYMAGFAVLAIFSPIIPAAFALLVAFRFVQKAYMNGVGIAAAAMLVYIIWRASQSYSQALVDALHSGQPRVFYNEDLSFSGNSARRWSMNNLLRTTYLVRITTSLSTPDSAPHISPGLPRI